jgi:hypothetical protein
VRVPTNDVVQPAKAGHAADVEVVLGCRIDLAFAVGTIVAAEGRSFAVVVNDDPVVVEAFAKRVGQAVDGVRGVVSANDAALAVCIASSLALIQAIVCTVSATWSASWD